MIAWVSQGLWGSPVPTALKREVGEGPMERKTGSRVGTPRTVCWTQQSQSPALDGREHCGRPSRRPQDSAGSSGTILLADKSLWALGHLLLCDVTCEEQERKVDPRLRPEGAT